MNTAKGAMTNNIMGYIARYDLATHEHIFKVVNDLGDQQIIWSLNRTTPSIGFHVWHLAR